jgi:hypothetical protein
MKRAFSSSNMTEEAANCGGFYHFGGFANWFPSSRSVCFALKS